MRIDVYLYKNGYCKSREEARKLIKSHCVRCTDTVIDKPSFDVAEGTVLNVVNPFKYVSRGGDKLEAALVGFGIDVKNCVCVDIGASTGGFTDCLLQNGADRVYAVDSGSGQLCDKIKYDCRVISMENVNARYLKESDLPEKCDICVMDVSFISQTLIHNAVNELLKDGGCFITLIKPQFEVGKQMVSKGGIVKDEKARAFAKEKVISSAKLNNFQFIDCFTSPIKGGDGNIEYLALFKKINKEADLNGTGKYR